MERMSRGEFVTIALQGDFGKPRPALIIQSDPFSAHATVAVLLVTTTLVEAPLFRIGVQPSETNGLRKPSQIMVDKILTIKHDKLGATIGKASDELMIEVSRSLAVFLGIVR
jgi:mRNA interferase MazF